MKRRYTKWPRVCSMATAAVFAAGFLLSGAVPAAGNEPAETASASADGFHNGPADGAVAASGANADYEDAGLLLMANGVSMDYSAVSYEDIHTHAEEIQKNMSNPTLETERFKAVQFPGASLLSGETNQNANKHWECHDYDGDDAGTIIWDPATATLTLDNVNCSEALRRHNQATNAANATIDFEAADTSDTVTIHLIGENVYTPVGFDDSIAVTDRYEQVMISVNCNLVIEAEEGASLKIEACSILRQRDDACSAIQVWDSAKGEFHDLTIRGGSLDLTANGSSPAIYAKNITVEDGNVTAESPEYSALLAFGGKITIESGESITVHATSAEGYPAIRAYAVAQDDSTDPECGILLGERMGSKGNMVATTKWLANSDSFYADTVFVPVGTETPLADTLSAPREVEVTYREPELSLDGANPESSSVEIEQAGTGSAEKTVTGDGLLSDDNKASAKNAEEVKELFEDVTGDNWEIEVDDRNGDPLDERAKVGTGCQVVLKHNGEEVDAVTVVVMGDVTGDGEIDTTDAMNVLNVIAETDVLEGVYDQASRVATDGRDAATVRDVTAILDIAAAASGSGSGN